MKGEKKDLGKKKPNGIEYFLAVFGFAIISVLPLIMFLSIFSGNLLVIKSTSFGFFEGMLAVSFVEFALMYYFSDKEDKNE